MYEVKSQGNWQYETTLGGHAVWNLHRPLLWGIVICSIAIVMSSWKKFVRKLQLWSLLVCMLWQCTITWYPEIAWPPGAPINIKIVAITLGYRVERNRHNALTFSQRAAPGIGSRQNSWGPSSSSLYKQWIRPVIEVLDQHLSCS